MVYLTFQSILEIQVATSMSIVPRRPLISTNNHSKKMLQKRKTWMLTTKMQKTRQMTSKVMKKSRKITQDREVNVISKLIHFYHNLI